MFPPVHGLELQPLDFSGLIAFVLATLMWSLIIWRVRRWAKNRQANKTELENAQELIDLYRGKYQSSKYRLMDCEASVKVKNQHIADLTTNYGELKNLAEKVVETYDSGDENAAAKAIEALNIAITRHNEEQSR